MGTGVSWKVRADLILWFFGVFRNPRPHLTTRYASVIDGDVRAGMEKMAAGRNAAEAPEIKKEVSK